MNGRILPTAAALVEMLPRVLRRHRLMTAWMRLTGEDPLQLVRIRDESFGYADMSDGFLRLIVIEGAFEKDFFALADALLGGGGVFLDVGANHGLLSFGLAGRHGNRIQFHLFEPNIDLVCSIHKSLAFYPSMQCRVVPAAVSDRVGVVSFLIDHEQTGASHIADDAAEQVASITIDAYLAGATIGGVALMKIDVEGHELAVLRGAGQSLESRVVQAIYFEYFEKWLSRVHPPHDLLDFLQSVEYEVCFCRSCDITTRGGATHTLREDLPGHGVPLLPIRDHQLPAMTDLLAVPREHVIRDGHRLDERLSLPVS